MGRRIPRRQCLRLLVTGGTLALAGCGMFSSEMPGAETEPPPEIENTQTDTRSERLNTSSSVGTSFENTEATSKESSNQPWPMFGYDAQNSGYQPNVSGPTGSVTSLWEADLGGEIWSSPAVSQGIVFVGSQSNTFHAIDENTGEVVWKYSTEDSIDSSPVVTEDRVYFGSSDNFVYSVSVERGTVDWRFETDAPVRSSPTLGDSFLYCTSHDGNIYALDPISGEEVWHFETSTRMRNQIQALSTNEQDYPVRQPVDGSVQPLRTPMSTPAVADGTVYVKVEFSLVAVDAETGEKEWSFNFKETVENSRYGFSDRANSNRKVGKSAVSMELSQSMLWVPSSPAIRDGTIYIEDNYSGSPILHGVDVETGNHQWQIEIQNQPQESVQNSSRNFASKFQNRTKQVARQFKSSPAIINNLICFGGNGVSAVDSQSVVKKWTFKPETTVQCSPAISENTIYFGGAEGGIYALSLETGEVRWTFQTEADIISSPAVSDGVIYIGGSDGTLYALTEEG